MQCIYCTSTVSTYSLYFKNCMNVASTHSPKQEVVTDHTSYQILCNISVYKWEWVHSFRWVYKCTVHIELTISGKCWQSWIVCINIGLPPQSWSKWVLSIRQNIVKNTAQGENVHCTSLVQNKVKKWPYEKDLNYK